MPIFLPTRSVRRRPRPTDAFEWPVRSSSPLHAKTMGESAMKAATGVFTLPGSVLQIEASELPPIQQDDLALIAADESDDVEFMQPR